MSPSPLRLSGLCSAGRLPSDSLQRITYTGAAGTRPLPPRQMAAPSNSQRARTVQEISTSLPPAQVLAAAKDFFSRQNGIYAAFVEQEGPSHITLRGQGGEEIVIGTFPEGEGTRVTASSYLFDQQIARFLSTLPPPEHKGVALPAPAADSAVNAA